MKIIEIRAAEGGQDSKLFAQDLANAYIRFADKLNWLTELLDNNLSDNSNLIRLKITGKNLEKLNIEAGGHRIQRIPPTEKRGRVHTSTVTVAILDENKEVQSKIKDSDISIEWFNGTIGAGGQNHQKTQNCARVTHIPTGIVRTGQTRSRKNSLKIAMDALEEDVRHIEKTNKNKAFNSVRKNQIGSGQRGDKIRTYRFQDDIVTDHNTGKTAKASKVMKGNFDLLWR